MSCPTTRRSLRRHDMRGGLTRRSAETFRETAKRYADYWLGKEMITEAEAKKLCQGHQRPRRHALDACHVDRRRGAGS